MFVMSGFSGQISSGVGLQFRVSGCITFGQVSPGWWEQLVTWGESYSHAWPALRRWDGDRQVQDAATRRSNRNREAREPRACHTANRRLGRDRLREWEL